MQQFALFTLSVYLVSGGFFTNSRKQQYHIPFKMKGKLIIFTFFALASCAKPNVFVLEDAGNDKYYLSDSIKIAFRKGYIQRSPLIAIGGVPFNYQKNLDTIILPLKKNQITSIDFLDKKSSLVIYGAKADNGAVIINTTALQEYISDTVRAVKVTK